MEELRDYLTHGSKVVRLNASPYEQVGWEMAETRTVSLLEAALAALLRQQAVHHGEISKEEMHAADVIALSHSKVLRDIEVPDGFLPRSLNDLWNRSTAFYDRVVRLNGEWGG